MPLLLRPNDNSAMQVVHRDGVPKRGMHLRPSRRGTTVIASAGNGVIMATKGSLVEAITDTGKREFRFSMYSTD